MVDGRDGAGGAAGRVPGPVPEPALTVAAVARRLGVAPATLRTWDRRYGLGPSAHTPGAHRRYTAEDVTRLNFMRQLTVEGVAPVDAARLALASSDGAYRADPQPLGTVFLLPLPSAPARWTPPAGSPESQPSRQSGGGRVVAMPGGSRESRGLARAALALDSHASGAIVEAALERDGVVETWDRLLVPVLTAIGERWAATGEGVEVEHLLAEVVTGSLSRIAVLPPPGDSAGAAAGGEGRPQRGWRNSRPVLLACVADELHVLALHAVAAALAERDVASRVLGARTPVLALRSAVERSGPIAVMLWSQTRRSADSGHFDGLAAHRPAPMLIASGPGWEQAALPASVHRADSLPGALALVERALTGMAP